MKKALFVLVMLICFVVGCSKVNNKESIQIEKQLGDFKLVIQSDKDRYHPGDRIKLSAYLEYMGEGEVELTHSKPLISVVLTKGKDRSNSIQNYDDIGITDKLKNGDKIYEEIEPIELVKGKYEIFAQTMFSINGWRNYLINTVPQTFEVK